MLFYAWPHTNTQALPTSTSTPTPTPYSDPLLPLPALRFFPAYLFQLTIFLQNVSSGTTNLQRYPYANAVFGIPSSRYLPHNFFPPLYLHLINLTAGFTQAVPTSNVTHTPTPPSDILPRVTHSRFYPVSLPQFTQFL